MTRVEIVDLEAEVWDALVAGDIHAIRELISDDFLGVYPNGFAGLGEYLAQLTDGPTVAEYEIRVATQVEVGDGAVLLCYQVRFRRTGRAEHETMYVSSLWCRRDGRWVNTFSQDTPEGDPVP